MAQIIAHQEIYEQLAANLKSGKLFPVLLFFGPSGVGKKLVAKTLIQDMFCVTSNHCGHCPACGKIAREEFEGLHILRPEGNYIKVDAVRDLLQKLTLQNLHTSNVIIIEDAERLNPQSANALLKTFEEPPPNTYFFLLSNQVQGLLPTIRSRSLPVGFRRLTAAEVASLSPDAPKWTIFASQGRMDVLQSYLQEDLILERKKALDFAQLLLENSKYTAFQKIREFISDESNYLQLSFFLQLFFRDASVYKLDPTKAFFQDQKSLLQKFSILDADSLETLFQKSLHIERQILANQDKGLVLESFWLESRQLCASL
jgi:DNA polymerase-3 subunit delta'